MLEAELAERFAAYAEARIPGARNASVASINRIHGGASRQTYSIDLAYEDATGPKVKGLILRRDPPDSLIDTERRVEFAAIKTAYGQLELPVPEALFLETETDALGAPFFVMGRIEKGEPLNPFKTKGPLKGWYIVADKQRDAWEALARSALAFTRTF